MWPFNKISEYMFASHTAPDYEREHVWVELTDGTVHAVSSRRYYNGLRTILMPSGWVKAEGIFGSGYVPSQAAIVRWFK